MPFVATGAARGVLLGFGIDVEVLAPTSLRQHFAKTAAAIVNLYRNEAGSGG
jgi:predicted DNA-binding transcriptional regulator YafY